MTEQASLEVRYAGGHPVVEVAGDVDLANAGEFEATLELAAGADRGCVVVSLTGATYFDSRGIHVLLRFGERLATARQKLLIVAPRGGVLRRILDISGIPQVFAVFDTVDEAIADCAAKPLEGVPKVHQDRSAHR